MGARRKKKRKSERERRKSEVSSRGEWARIRGRPFGERQQKLNVHGRP